MVLNSTLHPELNFLDLFNHVVIKEKLFGTAIDSQLEAFILKSKNNRFDLDQLESQLEEHLISFSLTRKEKEELKNFQGKPAHKAIKRIITINKQMTEKNHPHGEFGELLLYCFQEAYLKAPKIITKVKHKTSPTYVHGFDGVHLLKTDDGNYCLLFGEAKLKPTLKEGITESFDSINKKLTRQINNISDELIFVDTNIADEVIDEKMLKVIKDIIIPKTDTKTRTNHGFAIFVGYSFPITDAERSMNYDEFENLIQSKIIQEVRTQIPLIKKQVQDKNLIGYPIYLFILPLENHADDSVKIIMSLINYNHK